MYRGAGTAPSMVEACDTEPLEHPKRWATRRGTGRSLHQHPAPQWHLKGVPLPTPMVPDDPRCRKRSCEEQRLTLRAQHLAERSARGRARSTSLAHVLIGEVHCPTSRLLFTMAMPDVGITPLRAGGRMHTFLMEPDPPSPAPQETRLLGDRRNEAGEPQKWDQTLSFVWDLGSHRDWAARSCWVRIPHYLAAPLWGQKEGFPPGWGEAVGGRGRWN